MCETGNTLAPLALRVGLAVVFLFHGREKINEATDWGRTWMNKLPNPPAAEVQQAVAWGEVAGGIAMSLGLLTRLAAVGLAAIMAGAIYLVHGKNGFSLANGGYEYNFVLITVCLALLFMGAGRLSLDAVLWRKRKPAAGAAPAAPPPPAS